VVQRRYKTVARCTTPNPPQPHRNDKQIMTTPNFQRALDSTAAFEAELAFARALFREHLRVASSTAENRPFTRTVERIDHSAPLSETWDESADMDGWEGQESTETWDPIPSEWEEFDPRKELWDMVCKEFWDMVHKELRDTLHKEFRELRRSEWEELRPRIERGE